MARFYGTVKGGRGEATRLGHATSGLDVSAQSYSGDINIRMWVDGETDMVRIRVEPHGRDGTGYTLYHGPVNDLLHDETQGAIVKAFAERELQRRYGNE